MAPASRCCSRGFASLFSSSSQPYSSIAATRPCLHTRPTAAVLPAAAAARTAYPLAPATQVRTQATSRRTTKRLRQFPVQSAPRPHRGAVTHRAAVPKDDTLPTGSGTGTASSTGTMLTFDPPSAAPNPFHTPSVFLPDGDPRRKLFSGNSAAGAALRRAYNPYAAEPARQLPPLARPVPATSGKQHLTEADLKEMRELRAKDPAHWTRARLAQRFGCSEMFVAIGAPTTRERGDEWWGRQRARLMREGPKARKAREDRMKRRELWYRDA